MRRLSNFTLLSLKSVLVICVVLSIVSGLVVWRWYIGRADSDLPTVVPSVVASGGRRSCEGLSDSSVEILLGSRDLVYDDRSHGSSRQRNFVCIVDPENEGNGEGSLIMESGDGVYPLDWNDTVQSIRNPSSATEIDLSHIVPGWGSVYQNEATRYVDAVYVCGDNERHIRVTVYRYPEGSPVVENVTNLIASMLPELCGTESLPESGVPSESGAE